VLVARRASDGLRSKPHHVPVSRAAFEAADAHLSTVFPETPRERLLIGLEFAGHHGYTFAHFLAARGYPIVNVLPSVTKKTKEIKDNSPLKTDAKDAALIALLTSEGKFVRFPLLNPQYAALRQLTMARTRLTIEATRFKNRLHGLLDLAWPEFLAQFKDHIAAATPLALLHQWPTPEDILGASPQSVTRLIKRASKNHIASERIDSLLASARSTVGLGVATAERRMEIEQVLARWQLVREQIAVLDAELALAVEACPPARILTTVPEVGVVCAATIVSELGVPEDYEHPNQVLKLAGMNLVERSSGLLRGRKFQSKRGRPMLRRQLFLLAGRWCRADRGLSREYYDAYVARNGGLRIKAVCAVARRLVPMLLAVMQSGEPFDRERWLAAHARSPYRTM
jgi:transposase